MNQLSPEVTRNEVPQSSAEADRDVWQDDGRRPRLDTSVWLCGPPPATGQRQRYPGRFEYNLRKHYLRDGMRVLHMFSGSCEWGETTDVRPETGADIIAPYDALPEGLGPYDLVIADPPYNAGYGSRWLGESAEATLPKPKRIARSAMRVLKPGGLFLLLHIIILPAYKDLGMERVALHPVLTGPNNAIRVLNVMRASGDVVAKRQELTEVDSGI